MAQKKINNIPTTELFAAGHNACAGCGPALALRYALKAAGKNTVVVNATGCTEVFSTPYPLTAWKVPWLHVNFENAASAASGVDRALKKLGKRKKTNLLVIGGDGATFDIGMRALSGAFERGHKLTYLCIDNGAYMNTGIQRSGATPKYAHTTTTPYGSKIHGKQEWKKPMPLIMAMHNAYVATANIAYPQDMIKKIEKSLTIDGPSYIQVFSPCQLGWKFPSNLTIQISKDAYLTGVSPLYEIEDGVLKFTQKPSKIKPVKQYLKPQGRFKKLTDQEIKNVQEHVNYQIKLLEELEEKGCRFY